MTQPLDKIPLRVPGGVKFAAKTPRGSRTKFAHEPSTGMFLATKLLAGLAIPPGLDGTKARLVARPDHTGTGTLVRKASLS